jgi:hypothetical protein
VPTDLIGGKRRAPVFRYTMLAGEDTKLLHRNLPFLSIEKASLLSTFIDILAAFEEECKSYRGIHYR